MSTTQPILNDDLLDAIRAYFPRYPNRRAVVLPALHLVQERLGYVPTRRWWRLRNCWSFTRAKFKIHFPSTVSSSRTSLKASIASGSADRSAARPAAARRLLEYLCEKLGIRAGRDDGGRALLAGICRVPGSVRFRSRDAGGQELIGNLTREKIDAYVDRGASRNVSWTGAPVSCSRSRKIGNWWPSSNRSFWRMLRKTTAIRSKRMRLPGATAR
jgi:hypothetical protein